MGDTPRIKRGGEAGNGAGMKSGPVEASRRVKKMNQSVEQDEKRLNELETRLEDLERDFEWLARESGNPKVVERAVALIRSQGRLEIIGTDISVDPCLRYVVINIVEKQSVLVKIAENDPEWELRRAAVRRLNPLERESQAAIRRIAETDANPSVRHTAVNKIMGDEQCLARISRSDPDVHVRTTAFFGIDGSVERLKIVRGITDQAMLKKIVDDDSSGYVRCEAIAKITDPNALCEIIESNEDFIDIDDDHAVFNAANERLQQLGEGDK